MHGSYPPPAYPPGDVISFHPDFAYPREASFYTPELLLRLMEWDLTTIEHHDSCPWGENCNIVKPNDNYTPSCVWCFALQQSEWARGLLQDAYLEVSELKERLVLARKSQPQTRWDAYGF